MSMSSVRGQYPQANRYQDAFAPSTERVCAEWRRPRPALVHQSRQARPRARTRRHDDLPGGGAEARAYANPLRACAAHRSLQPHQLSVSRVLGEALERFAHAPSNRASRLRTSRCAGGVISMPQGVSPELVENLVRRNGLSLSLLVLGPRLHRALVLLWSASTGAPRQTGVHAITGRAS